MVPFSLEFCDVLNLLFLGSKELLEVWTEIAILEFSVHTSVSRSSARHPGANNRRALLPAWRCCRFSSHTLRAGRCLWIWGWWRFIPLRPAPTGRQGSLLPTSLQWPYQPPAEGSLQPMVSRVPRNSWAKADLGCLPHRLPVFTTSGVFQMSYFHVNSVTHLKIYFVLFNITLHRFLYFI